MARPSFKDQDVLGLAQDNGQALILVLLVRGGLVTGSRDYFFAELPPDGDLLGAFVKQYYAEGRPLPDEMLLPLEIRRPTAAGGRCSAKRKARRCACWCPRRASGCGSWTWRPKTPGTP